MMMMLKNEVCRGLKTKGDNVPWMGLWESNLPNSQIRKGTPKNLCQVTGSGSWHADTIFCKSKRHQVGITKETGGGGVERRMDKGGFLTDVAKSLPQQERL